MKKNKVKYKRVLNLSLRRAYALAERGYEIDIVAGKVVSIRKGKRRAG